MRRRRLTSAERDSHLVISMMLISNAHPEDIDVEREHLEGLAAHHQVSSRNAEHRPCDHDFEFK
jgi:hypothetical protein